MPWQSLLWAGCGVGITVQVLYIVSSTFCSFQGPKNHSNLLQGPELLGAKAPLGLVHVSEAQKVAPLSA